MDITYHFLDHREHELFGATFFSMPIGLSTVAVGRRFLSWKSGEGEHGLLQPYRVVTGSILFPMTEVAKHATQCWLSLWALEIVMGKGSLR